MWFEPPLAVHGRPVANGEGKEGPTPSAGISRLAGLARERGGKRHSKRQRRQRSEPKCVTLSPHYTLKRGSTISIFSPHDDSDS